MQDGKPFAGTSMTDLMTAARLEKGGLYRHFPSKDDLVFEQARRWLLHFNDHIAQRRPGEGAANVRTALDLVAAIGAAGVIASDRRTAP